MSANIILAPMHGLTDQRFRKAYAKAFPNAELSAISPFVSHTHGRIRDSKRKFRELIPFEERLVPQILGSSPEGIREVANEIYKLGYKEVNLNMGCSVSRINRKTRGSKLLKYPNKVEEIIERITRDSPFTVSIKLRLGYESKEEILDIIPIINSYPISSVIIHPRIGIEGYNERVDLESFEEAYKLIRTKVVYNGDILCLQDYIKLKERFPDINDWMIGRGILRNPLLGEEIRRSEAYNRISNKEAIIRLYSELSKLTSSLNKTKEYWSYFSYGFGLESKERENMMKTRSLDELNEVIKRNIK